MSQNQKTLFKLLLILILLAFVAIVVLTLIGPTDGRVMPGIEEKLSLAFRMYVL